MAIGDIGAVIESTEYLHATEACNLPKITADNIVVEVWLYNQSIECATYSINPLTGDISNAFLDRDTLVSGYVLSCSPVFHVAGNVYGFWYNRNYTYNNVATFSVSSSGIISAIIATYQFKTTNRIDARNAETQHVAGTTYFDAGYRVAAGVYTLELRTWSISADGATISNIASAAWDIPSGNSFYLDIRQISGNVYGVFMHFTTHVPVILTYTISDAGAISYIGTHDLDTGGSASLYRLRACKVAGSSNIFAVGYINGAATYRIKTLVINADGTFGDDVDTDDTLYDKLTVHQLYNIAGTAYMLSYGTSSGLGVKSFTIEADGTIGAVIDTLAGISGYVCYLIYTGSGDMYTGIYQASGVHNLHIFALSVGVITLSGYTQGHIIG